MHRLPLTFWVVLATTIAGMVPARVAAQVNTLVADNPREDARLKLGPLYVTPRIGLTELGVDNNVFNDHEKTERKSDFTFTVTPTAMVWLPFSSRGVVKTSIASDLIYYREFDSERSVDANAAVRGEAYFHRFTLFADAAVVHAKQRPNEDLDLRVRRTTQAVGGGIDARVSPKVFLELGAGRESFAYDRETSVFAQLVGERLDRTATRVGGALRFRHSPLTTLALRGERLETRFTATPERDNDSVRVMAGAQLKPRALISGSAFFGVRHLNPVNELLLDEFKGFVSDVLVRYTMGGATTFELRHSRDLDYSAETIDPYFVQNRVGLAVRRALGPHFDVVLEGGRSVSNYRPYLDAAVPPEDARRDVNVSFGASFGIRVGRGGRIGLGAAYTRRDSTDVLREYDGLRIRTTATYGF